MHRTKCALWPVMASTILTVLLSGMVSAGEPDLRNSIGMEFVLIPAGTFTMGSPVYEAFRNEGETPHQVTISRPFYLQTTQALLKFGIRILKEEL